MPFGVSKDFLDLTRQAQRRALSTVAIFLLLVLAGGFVAEMLDQPRFGAFVLLYLGGLGLGALLGGLLGWLETRSWGRSLKDGWQTWMHSAQGAGSMGEAAQRAGARNLAFGGAAAVVLLALNACMLIAAWFTLPPLAVTTVYGALAVITVLLTGAALTALLVLRIVEAWWCRTVEKQTLELVEEGRIGVWGVR